MNPTTLPQPSGNPDLIFHQLLLGPMANFCYLIGSRRTRECVLVDPAWEIDGLLEQVAALDLRLVGTLATHGHPDHVGGEIFGMSIEGLAALQQRVAVPVHTHRLEAETIRKVTGLSASDLVLHDSGDVVRVGDVEVQLVHTPGHTPGSLCFVVNDGLVSGDTLFIQACGRVDLPGGNPEQMYESLTQKLAKMPPATILYPGHDYADRPTSTLADELRSNRFLRATSLQSWLALMGVSPRHG
jgi:hydroxyacylglutathione hydrolase